MCLFGVVSSQSPSRRTLPSVIATVQILDAAGHMSGRDTLSGKPMSGLRRLQQPKLPHFSAFELILCRPSVISSITAFCVLGTEPAAERRSDLSSLFYSARREGLACSSAVGLSTTSGAFGG